MLNFVGGAPFHGPLMPQWQVLFYVVEQETPSRSKGLGFYRFQFLPIESNPFYL